jgi:hypothetical protein
VAATSDAELATFLAVLDNYDTSQVHFETLGKTALAGALQGVDLASLERDKDGRVSVAHDTTIRVRIDPDLKNPTCCICVANKVTICRGKCCPGFETEASDTDLARFLAVLDNYDASQVHFETIGRTVLAGALQGVDPASLERDKDGHVTVSSDATTSVRIDPDVRVCCVCYREGGIAVCHGDCCG